MQPFHASPGEVHFWQWFLCVFLPVTALAGIVCFIISLPLRRQERARFLLEVMQSALAEGEPIERRIISLSRTKDPAIGLRFHLLAYHLESGLTLIPALEKSRGLLPAQLLAMLKIGASTGNIACVLPACRKLLHDGLSQTRAAINYQVIFALALNPIIFAIPLFISVKVVPVFNDISTSMHIPITATNYLRYTPWLMGLQIIFVLILYRAALFFLGGPGFSSWLEAGLPKISSWSLYRVPWRRKRLQRDFSAMLALLLDAGLPEIKAVTLAAASTTNTVFIHRAAAVCQQLQSGAKLTEAIHLIDDTGEFRWRLANAAHVSSNFFKALQGWHDSLDARAFQQEQAAAQTISTAFVLLNASIAFLVAASVFQAITQISGAPFR